MAAPRFLISTPVPDQGVVELSDEEAHHARQVLRLRRGDLVRLFDGAGHEWEGRLQTIGARRLTIAIESAVESAPEPPVAVTLAVGLLKGAQMDTVVRETTVLGVTAILPLLSSRVVAPARGRVTPARSRWRRVAVQAAKQCGRAVVPELREAARFEDLLRDDQYEVRLILSEPGTGVPAATPPAASRPRTSRAPVLLVSGPEGGWTAEEIKAAIGCGFQPWQLGPRTIRAELAPAVALAALWTLWGWV